VFILFFFFQAEDGIRDFHVTGVQTCALPIYPGKLVSALVFWVAGVALDPMPANLVLAERFVETFPKLDVLDRFLIGGAPVVALRSEERRVGKECGSGWLSADYRDGVGVRDGQ